MPHRAYLMIVAEDMPGVALMERSGVFTLPCLDGWDGDFDSFAAALSRWSNDTVVATSQTDRQTTVPPLTVLANLAEVTSGSAEDADRSELFLCEPWPGADLSNLSWLPVDTQDLEGVPPTLMQAVRETYVVLSNSPMPVESGVPWPLHSLPGATRTIAAALAADATVAALARLPDTSSREPATDLRQLRGWSLSSVWTNDDFVLKVTHPSWGTEPAINKLLNSAAPHLVEEVVASGWLRQSDGPGSPWLLQRRARRDSAAPDDNDPAAVASYRQDVRLKTARALAALQLSLVDQAADLLAAGLVDRTIPAVTGALPDLWRSPELANNLEQHEKAELRHLDIWLRERLAELAALGAPPLLAHGDLHLGNVIPVADGQLRFIDWTDAALSWAGVDLLTLLPAASEEALREELITVYEEAVGPVHAPVVRPGLVLARLFHALGYAKIDAFLPPSARWQLGGTVTGLVRRLFVEAKA